MTTETNLPVESDAALRETSDRLLQAAMDYWHEFRRVTGGAAVVWVKDTDGRMVVLTRGEYRHQLMNNIEQLYEAEERLFDYDGNERT